MWSNLKGIPKMTIICHYMPEVFYNLADMKMNAMGLNSRHKYKLQELL